MPELSPSQRSFVYCHGCTPKRQVLDPDDPSTYEVQTSLDPEALDLLHVFEIAMSDYLELSNYEIVVQQDTEDLIISASFGEQDKVYNFEARGVFNNDGNLILTTDYSDEVLVGIENGMLFISDIAELVWDKEWDDIWLEVKRYKGSDIIHLQAQWSVQGRDVACDIEYNLALQ